MNNEHYAELITSYLDGSITPGERAKLNKLIDTGEINILDVKEMESLYQMMEKLPDTKPRKSSSTRFYTMLDEEKKKQAPGINETTTNWIKNLQSYLTLPRLALMVVIFLIGIFLGNWTTPFQNYRGELETLSSEVSQMREVMMMSLLDNSSATQRLKAVNISSDIRSVDKQITGALLKTLNNDPNVNVRLAAVEALIQHAKAPQVREGLIASINKQESPLVQSALADAMILLQEERSVKEFRQLLDQNELDPDVRNKLENVVAVLS